MAVVEPYIDFKIDGDKENCSALRNNCLREFRTLSLFKSNERQRDHLELY